MTAGKVKDPARLDNFRIDVNTPVSLSPDQVSGLEDAVRHCLVHNTLLHTPKIELAVNLPELSEVAL